MGNGFEDIDFALEVLKQLGRELLPGHGLDGDGFIGTQLKERNKKCECDR